MSEDIVTKTCTGCHEAKPLSEFCLDARNRDGYGARCRTCANLRVVRWQKTVAGKASQRRATIKYRQTVNGRARVRAANRRYQLTEKGRQAGRRGEARYAELHPDRRAAKKAVRLAIEAGQILTIESLSCVKCSEPAKHYHHDSYAKEHWLDVIALCQECHTLAHKSTALSLSIKP